MEKHGTKELEEVLDFLFDMGDAYTASMKDGKFNWTDLPRFISSVTKMPNAINGIDQVPKEALDFSDEEIQALVEKYGDKIPGTDEDKKKLILLAIERGLLFADTIVEIAQYKKAA